MVPPGRSPCAAAIPRKWKPIRSRSHAACTKDNAFGWQGEAGARGGKKGDLFLRVRLARHPDFAVEGNDLVHEAELSPSQAVLGTELEVPTLEGYRRLKIPPGTQAGQRFRLRGRGLPAATGDRGNLYVVTQITIPKKLSDAERAIWQQLAAQRSS